MHDKLTDAAEVDPGSYYDDYAEQNDGIWHIMMDCTSASTTHL